MCTAEGPSLLRTHSRGSQHEQRQTVGGELEFVDGGTLAHAMAGRRSLL